MLKTFIPWNAYESSIIMILQKKIMYKINILCDITRSTMGFYTFNFSRCVFLSL